LHMLTFESISSWHLDQKTVMKRKNVVISIIIGNLDKLIVNIRKAFFLLK